MLDKKQIWVIFLFEFKMGHETAETTHNINNASGPGTANEHAAQWWFKKFRKEDESLKEGAGGEGGGRGDRDGEDMWTQGLFISMYDKIHYK